MKLSHHSILRLTERINIPKQNQKSFFRSALVHGKSAGELKDGAIKDFLLAKENNCKVKLYKGYIFIYSKNSHQLYTVYKLPEKLLKESEVN